MAPSSSSYSSYLAYSSFSTSYLNCHTRALALANTTEILLSKN
jgi:hypothetical protein